MCTGIGCVCVSACVYGHNCDYVHPLPSSSTCCLGVGEPLVHPSWLVITASWFLWTRGAELRCLSDCQRSFRYLARPQASSVAPHATCPLRSSPPLLAGVCLKPVIIEWLRRGFVLALLSSSPLPACFKGPACFPPGACTPQSPLVLCALEQLV